MRPDRVQFSRRRVIAGGLALSGGLLARPAMADGLERRFKTIETNVGGRLGIWAQQGGGKIVAYRADERFLMCSTFKALAVSVLAHRLVLTPEADMEGFARETVIETALEQVPHRCDAAR